MTITDEERRERNRQKQARWAARQTELNGYTPAQERNRRDVALTKLCRIHQMEYEAERIAQREAANCSARAQRENARRRVRDKYPEEFAKILAKTPMKGTST